MEFSIVEEAKNYLMTYLNGKTCEYETLHPWRNNSKYIILHSLRVHAYVVKIIENEFCSISDDDRTIIEVAAMLHDIGKIEILEGHARNSAKIVRQWLDNNADIAKRIKNTDRLIKVIETHSDKEGVEEDLCSKIIKDADILDEIGALSIFMASNRVDRQSPFFFNDLLERLSTFEIEFCNKKMYQLNTEYGKKLLMDKMEFINKFNEELAFELDGTNDIYKSSL
jgi:HD superfamily phosphodiesterase